MIEANWQVPTVFNEPAVVKHSGNHEPFQGSVSIVNSFVNYLSVPITLVMRSGFRFQLQPEASMTTRALICRTRIEVRGDALAGVNQFLSAINELASPELRAMRDAFSMTTEFQQYRRSATITLDYPIDYETLRNHGGTVYYSELDMVVSLDSPMNVCEHPYSQAGRDVQYANTLPVAVDGLDFNYAFSIIDNEGTIGPRFLNINNNVYKVTPKRDSTRKDGVYLVSNGEVGGSEGQTGIYTRRYSLTEVEDIHGLYATYEEAKTLGNLQAAAKRTLLELEQKVVTEKLERESALLTQKQTYETLLATAERERLVLDEQRRQAEETHRKMEAEAEKRRLEMKDLYEERSQRRKDSGETIKFLPHLIIGLGAVLMAFNKWAS